ncbi:MAG: hypothetical protein KC431_05070, partial [Myxococcales bacterium]|nr:hypothetical protein [Myxococcales bacterium]
MARGDRPLSLACLLLALSACTAPPSGDDDVGDTGDGTDTGETGDTGQALRPNWHEDIAPIAYANCVGCHRDGGIAPFSLEDYQQAAAWSASIDQVVASGEMPPWGALETEECQPEHSWANDLRLADADKQLIADWVAAGSPEGDPADAVELPAPPDLSLADPTATFQNPTPFSVEGTEDSFICFSIDPGLTSDVWVTGVQMVPDNQKVVHHALIYADPDANSAAVAGPDGSYPCFGTAGVSANLIGTWVPGAVPTEMPDNVGLSLPAGSRIILAYHYHPTGGGTEIDQSAVALRWTEHPPADRGRLQRIGNVPTAPELLP